MPKEIYARPRTVTHVAVDERERHDMTFLNTRGLADRWKCSTRKIEQLRQSGGGPPYVKIGSQVLYDEETVRNYETDNTFGSTAECVD